jgi:hypothetical protein
MGKSACCIDAATALPDEGLPPIAPKFDAAALREPVALSLWLKFESQTRPYN